MPNSPIQKAPLVQRNFAIRFNNGNPEALVVAAFTLFAEPFWCFYSSNEKGSLVASYNASFVESIRLIDPMVTSPPGGAPLDIPHTKEMSQSGVPFTEPKPIS